MSASTDNSLVKGLFYFLNVLFFIVSGVVLGFALYVLIGGPSTGYGFPSGLVIGAVCISGFVLLTSLFGCGMVKHRSCLVFYTIMLFVLIVSQVTLGVLMYKQVLDPRQTLDTVWSGISKNDRAQIQQWGNCCGFSSPTDRYVPSETCSVPNLAVMEACYPALEKQFQSTATITMICAFVFLAFELLAFIICVLISCGCCKTEAEKLKEANSLNHAVYV